MVPLPVLWQCVRSCCGSLQLPVCRPQWLQGISAWEETEMRYLKENHPHQASWVFNHDCSSCCCSLTGSLRVYVGRMRKWVGLIDAWKLQSRISDWQLIDKCALPSVAELWPAAVCEEQCGRAGVVQFERRPGGFPPSDRRPGEMASAAAAGTNGLWHHCSS